MMPIQRVVPAGGLGWAVVRWNGLYCSAEG